MTTLSSSQPVYCRTKKILITGWRGFQQQTKQQIPLGAWSPLCSMQIREGWERQNTTEFY
jgi:hypothetical protein